MRSLVSYIIPVFHNAKSQYALPESIFDFIEETVLSINSQTVPIWDLCILTDKQYFSRLESLINRIGSQKGSAFNTKLRLELTESISIIDDINRVAFRSKGKFFCLVKAGDLVAPHATYELIHASVSNPRSILIYAHSDSVNCKAIRLNPFFKPSFSPDLLLSQNYIEGLVAIRKTWFIAQSGFNAHYQLAFQYDFYLETCLGIIGRIRATRHSLRGDELVVRVDHVLYHSRLYDDFLIKDGLRVDIQRRLAHLDKKIKQEQYMALKSRMHQLDPKIKTQKISTGLFRVIRPIPRPTPLVSIIIPTKDAFGYLRTCIESLLNKTNYHNYEIIIIDNQSTCKDTLNFLVEIERSHKNIRVIKFNKPFNYSEINNFAVQKSQGEIIAFLNNDVEIISPNWLNNMVSHAIRPEVGCVGAMLYYPDFTIQHAGVIVGMHGVADHAFKGRENNLNQDYFGYLRSLRNPKAVTAAVMLVRKKIFLRVGGFDQKRFPVAFNDVDLCLKIFEKGYYNVWLPNSELIHHESKTRIKEGLMDSSPEITAFKRKYSKYSLVKFQHYHFHLMANI